MDRLAILDLVYLALANPANPELRIEKMFDWYFSREMEIVKWSLGAASGLVIALLPGMVDPTKFPAGPKTFCAVALALIAIGGCSALAIFKLQAIREGADLYVPAMQIVLFLQGVSTP
jgi:hypothetical protein